MVFTFLDGHELGFQRYDDFIEGIDIFKGYNVIEMFEKPDYWLEGLEEHYNATAERSLETIE